MVIRELKYYWMAHTTSGKVVPQFTRNGIEQRWDDVLCSQKISRIYWMPFDPDSASCARRSPTLSFWPVVDNVPVLWLDIPEGEYGIPLSTSDLEKYNYWHCEMCGGNVYYHGDDGTPLHCPACGAKNEWFCEECDTIIDHPVFKPKNKVECPIHDGQGLIKTKCLTLHKETEYRTVFSLAINNMYAMEYDGDGNFIRKYGVGDILGVTSRK